jgi:L,D-transpeptidase ErfK/SrfK
MKSQKSFHISLIIYFLLGIFFHLSCLALEFPLPPPGNDVVGTVKTAIVRDGEDFSDIAERFNIGYYELFEANPGVDPDDPPEGTVLIVPTQYILPQELRSNMVLVNLAELRLYYEPKDGSKVYVFSIGIGKEDWATPLGTFSILEKIKDPRWVVPVSIMKFRQSIGDPVPKVVPPGPDNPMGNYALRTSNTSLLIHGTNAPEGIGRRSSAGCIRLYPKDIELLFHLVDVGTPVKIVNDSYKVGWLNGKLYLESHLPLFEQRMKFGEDVTPALHLLEAANKLQLVNINWDKATKAAKDHLAVPQEVQK